MQHKSPSSGITNKQESPIIWQQNVLSFISTPTKVAEETW
jgi:hypothetical protein